MKRRWIFLICLLTAGCSAATVGQNEISPNHAAGDGSIRTRIDAKNEEAPKGLTGDVSIEANIPAPARETVSLFPNHTSSEPTRADGRESQVASAYTASENNEDGKLAGLAEPADSRNGPAGSVDEKPEKDSEPSPHDISLPVPEAEDLIKVPQTPEAKKPKAFLYDVPVVRNAIVDRWIEYFTGPGRPSFSVWLGRGGRYIGLFREILEQRRLPKDLAYLSLIESGFNPKARSRAGAVGPWQFMPGTARRMGLKINFYLDERRHPMKSTRAAAAYLSKLYEEFGDWYLALAAYNAGEHRIARAIRRSGRKDYWSLARTRYLPNETRNYVAKYLAGMIIAKKPGSFRIRRHRLRPPLEL